MEESNQNPPAESHALETPAESPLSSEANQPTVAPEAPASWADLGLSNELLELIEKAGFKTPTEVQVKSIPAALEGKDLIVSSRTGSGKTATFTLPVVERIAGRKGTLCVMLAPTREIAQQIQATLDLFATPRGVRSCVLIGGVDMKIDFDILAQYPEIIVATPGRLCDHIERGKVWLDYVECLVLDEADRMLDMGFSDQLNKIVEQIPVARQTLLFSASIAPPVEKLARKILRDPLRVQVGAALATAKTVEQHIRWVSEDDKYRELRSVLEEEPGTMMVFVRSKDGASRLWRRLHSSGVYDVTVMHSDLLQAHREKALADFKEGKFRVLIATDVVGRGIHVDGVARVVNYDLPIDPEEYIHRVGRTGRMDQQGKATSFVTPRDKRYLLEIEKLLKSKLSEEPARSGQQTSRVTQTPAAREQPVIKSIKTTPQVPVRALSTPQRQKPKVEPLYKRQKTLFPVE